MPIQEVVHHLQSLNEIHQQLVSLAERKKDILIAGQVDELMKMVNQESRLAKAVAEHEQAWLNAAFRFVNQKGFQPGPNFNMTALIRMVTSVEEKQALQQEQAKLLALIGELKERNHLNQQLIEQSLAFVNYSLDLVAGDDGQDMTYQKPDGSPHNAANGRRMFDTRA